jgi:hypothetical protein
MFDENEIILIRKGKKKLKQYCKILKENIKTK